MTNSMPSLMLETTVNALTEVRARLKKLENEAKDKTNLSEEDAAKLSMECVAIRQIINVHRRALQQGEQEALTQQREAIATTFKDRVAFTRAHSFYGTANIKVKPVVKSASNDSFFGLGKFFSPAPKEKEAPVNFAVKKSDYTIFKESFAAVALRLVNLENFLFYKESSYSKNSSN